MSKHNFDLILCRKQTGTGIGKLCSKDEGKCPICDSYVRPYKLVRICDECNFGNNHNKCIICGNEGIADAYYCRNCVLQEKDRDGCPKVINIGTSRTDMFYERQKQSNQK